MHYRLTLVPLAGLALAMTAMIATPAVAAPGTPATTVRHAPVDRPGPELTVPSDVLAASLDCSPGIDEAAVDPVLLLSGTTVDPPENFDWNYQPALTAAGIPYCTSTAPGRNMADIAVRGEYVVYALRTMAERAGRDVAVVGHSQGGMVTRWALRFWPDTRELVSDLIGLAPSNNGTLTGSAACTPLCAPAIWQQRTGSKFLAALNSGRQTFGGVDYTVVYTDLDAVVTPQPAGSVLAADGAADDEVTNVALQQVCPGSTADHIATGTYDAVAWALVLDALTHDGPADPDRIDPAVCTQPLMPGVNPLTFPADSARSSTLLAMTLATYPRVAAEPELACYARAEGCEPAA
ncbi:esterase/lipase family protein [Pseudonocardia bannensis]|uniref:Lipase n=1 Tax=Pseudonocardia bannensis TaxID=630973 RepID=A0A848DJ53_9PSEU|nr:lipase [Pseudonocardia bannensis]NMH92730.1 lipase [Pseudonocardia bannensis]